MKGWKYTFLLVGLTVALSACSRQTGDVGASLFTLLPSSETGVTFNNKVVEGEGINVLEYEYFYNGGGVAVGDINNDGLPDLYFTANMGPDELYLNKGDLTFENITTAAGLTHEPSWTTGVTMADVNGDGFLDIYVGKSGRVSEDRRRNELYINNGDGTFTERAVEYGLDDASYSNHASFFDYDRDGDLDMFLLNHAIKRFSHFVHEYMRVQRDPLAGDKFYRNDDGVFVDVSEEAGIIGNPLGYGLSDVVTDINKDGWLDLYIANDYIEDDYLYINNGDGTFTESIRDYLTHTSYSSMGTDIADFNNDALPDIVTLDMLAEDNMRQKILKGPENEAYYRQMRENGYHEQYMRNMLHVNNGNGTFSEIGQIAGVSNTDWSWASLFADFDNDGYKDLFVTNGYMRDYTNMDFLEFTLKNAYQEAAQRGENLTPFGLVQQMPQSQLRNYLFRNEHDLTFSNQSKAWGVDQPALSNGAAYADLDNDGDLDLIINNINQEAFIYRNEASQRAANAYLKIKLEGSNSDRFGVGAKVELTTSEGQVFYQEMVPGRGYLSVVEPVLHFGLGSVAQVSLRVDWPDGSTQSLASVSTNQTLTLKQEDATAQPPTVEDESIPLFTEVSNGQGLALRHLENAFVDFDREPLLPHKLSRLGPALASADINRDGLEDVFIGGASGQPAALFLQQAAGTFTQMPVEDFEAHQAYEDVDALFIDIEQDGDLDLYVVSGGNHEAQDLSIYQDRVYVNNGFGGFTYDATALPEMPSSGAAVAAHDVDQDGDQDLFVAGRVLSGRYPFSPRSYLLRNEGGHFVDVTESAAPLLLEPGMVTDAQWADLDGDQVTELILAGEWMPIRVFRPNEDLVFSEVTEDVGLGKTGGWWNRLLIEDLDGDGDLDVVAGNRGLNAQMQASVEEPAAILATDFDGNGTVDPLMSYYIQGQSYPVANRDELLAQIPSMEEKFPTYAAYAQATMGDLLTNEQRAEALHLQAQTFATTLFENQGDGTLRSHVLPLEAQFAPVNDILFADFDRDGHRDLLLAGNNFAARVQQGRYNAGQGLLLRGNGTLAFETLLSKESGFLASGDVRRLSLVPTATTPLVLVANNNASIKTFSY